MKRTASLETQIEERWLKDPDFRKALKADPKATLEKELQLEFPDKMEIKVLEDTYTHRHIVLPGQDLRGAILSDRDLEAVAGGCDLNTRICGGRTCFRVSYVTW